MTDSKKVGTVTITFDVHLDREPESGYAYSWEPGYDYIAVRDYTVVGATVDPGQADYLAHLLECDGAEDIDPDALGPEAMIAALDAVLPNTEWFEDQLKNMPRTLDLTGSVESNAAN